MNAWTLAGLGLNLAVVIMIVTWLVARKRDNAGFGDIGWAYGFTLIIVVFCLNSAGAASRRLLLGAMVGLWSLRLGTHLWVRLAYRGEDPRYRELREQFPKRVWRMFFGFFLLQAVLLGLLVASFGVICANPDPVIRPLEWSAVGLWAIALLGETIADTQLLRFKIRPENKDRVCDTGLWSLSRHPNHFFEFLIWVAFFAFAAAAPGGWWMIYAPLLVLLLVRKISGVPAAEASSLKTSGDAYRDYQRRVPIFVPGFPRKSGSPARSA